MRKLYVLYDSRCGVCSRLRVWMREQAAHVAVEFVAAGSRRARTLFPELEHDEEPSELVAVTDDGDVYVNESAWIVCLYALIEFRPWSFRLARGPLRPLARGAWELLSANRQQLSRMLALTSDAELARRLGEQPAPACRLDRLDELGGDTTT